MRLCYDKPEDALYIRFEESPYAESDEVEEGIVFDYDKKGKIIGIEILNASKKLSSSFRASLFRNKIPIKIGA